MFILSNLLFSLAKILDILLSILWWVILARAVISWVNPDPFNQVVQFLEKITEPILGKIRSLLPADLRLGIDISPIIAFLAITFLRSFLVATLFDLARRLV